MSYSVDGHKIEMTRGDTVKIRVGLKYKQTGETYVPQEGDKITFTAVNPIDEAKAIEKEIPTDTLLLSLSPDDTANLTARQYSFDVQLTYANGDIDTFIDDGVLNIGKDQTK